MDVSRLKIHICLEVSDLKLHVTMGSKAGDLLCMRIPIIGNILGF